MRTWLILFMLGFDGVQAQELDSQLMQSVLQLSGVGLLCEQAQPLLEQGLPEAARESLGKAFSAQVFCQRLGDKLQMRLSSAQLRQAQRELQASWVQRFTVLEQQVGQESEGLKSYRAQVAERPVRGERVELLKQLDKAAQTSELAYVMRYEIGKTQLQLALQQQSKLADEQQLIEHTQDLQAKLRQASEQGVQSFMLYAYRRVPSSELQPYVQLHQAGATGVVLKAVVDTLPGLFAEQRADLRR